MIKRFTLCKNSKKQVYKHIDEINHVDLTISPNIISVVEDIKKNGDRALLKYTIMFDKAAVKGFKVPLSVIKAAYLKIDQRVLPSIKKTIKNITTFHLKQKQSIKNYVYQNTGYKIRQKYIPLESAGIYIPGGQAPLFSTVLMAGIPAKVAGVKNIAIASPPRYEGEVNPYILVAADMIGIHDIYRMGGAQAIAAFAFGTESVPKVGKVVGPGNIYSTMAKKYLFGAIDIDSISGPSEITIIADETANERFMIYDLLAQAEHVNGHALLLTVSKKLADDVEKGVKKSFKNKSFDVTIVTVKNMDEAIKISNYKAPEHLLVVAKNKEKILSKITNAGAIFAGNYSAVAFGDYIAGANHILPTNGTAKFFSALSVHEFIKHTHIVECTPVAIKTFGKDVEIMAGFEKLEYHRNSIRVRR